MKLNFSEIENKILKFWKENNIFEKLRDKNKGNKPWSFLDGPITANNPMGVHHAWGRTYKDMFQRYKAMRGFDQRFQNGFDCQGLWVEVGVEKELGFKNKKDIEDYGIDKFVMKCKENVERFSKIQTAQSIRLGQWMDWENSYYTMSEENNYAIWYFLKQCYSKGLLYKGRDVVPWCPRCGTAISQHEILTEEYQELSHNAVYVKFPWDSEKNTYFLAWTTTPWTLPANVALAVNPEMDYVKVKDKEGDILVVAKPMANLIGDGKQIGKPFKGKALEGQVYKGIFDYLPLVRQELGIGGDGENGKFFHSILCWDGVTEDEGTGIVHIAPGCGKEDFELSKIHSLPVINPTDDDSKYKDGFGELSGEFVGSKRAKEVIFKVLEDKGLLFKINKDYKHRYPVCWRCKSELIFRLVDEWYIKMDTLRDGLKKITRGVRWIPEFGMERELDWLKNMHDWMISKKRYWGLALPIFECKKCGNFEVIGSRQELKERAVEGWDKFEGHSPHRPWVDAVKIKCSKCGAKMSRIKDVGTPWLDAGIVPFSTMKYFEDRDYWKKWFPAELICESLPGQFKNWFYALLTMSYVLEGRSPFKTVLGFQLVLDENGEEMHKSKGNAIWFDEAVEKMGADVMRWMYVRQNPSRNLRFGYKYAEEVKAKLAILWNAYGFFKLYGAQKSNGAVLPPAANSVLDQWILSRLASLISKVTDAMENFQPDRASGAIEKFFIEDVSLWYVRRSRKRIKQEGDSEGRQAVSSVLRFVLLSLVKLIAPMIPFLAEEIYQNIKTNEMPESVHLLDWPEPIDELLNPELENKMEYAREIVSEILSQRAEQGIKIRQPLKSATVSAGKYGILKKEQEILNLVLEEVNIREMKFSDKIEKVELDTKITPELEEEGWIREIVRNIQQLRKKAGLVPSNQTEVYFKGAKNIEETFMRSKDKILTETRSVKAINSASPLTDYTKEITLGGEKFSLGIKKV